MKAFFIVLFSLSSADVFASGLTESNRQFVDSLTRSQNALESVNGPEVKCKPIHWTSSDGSPILTSDGAPVLSGSYRFYKVTNKLGKAKAPNGSEFDISIVDKDTAEDLFSEMASQEHIPFRFPEDGCYARAHEMSRLLEEKGYITGKVFIEGNLKVETTNSPQGFVEWWYHVAPIVLVEENGEVVPYVIDPSIFKKPVPAEEWFAIQTKHPKGRRDRTYQTPRFVYTPSRSIPENLKKFAERDLDSAKRTMEEYLRIQKERQKIRSKGSSHD